MTLIFRKEDVCYSENRNIVPPPPMKCLSIKKTSSGYRCGCDHMVVGFITTYAISAYHH
jgi:hypothetical protein